MSGVGATRNSANRPAERPIERKPRRIESTSFDLALAQALAVPSGSAPSASAAAKAAHASSGDAEKSGGGRPEAAMESSSMDDSGVSRVGGDAAGGKSPGRGLEDARDGSAEESGADSPLTPAEGKRTPSAPSDRFVERLEAASGGMRIEPTAQERGSAPPAARPGAPEGSSTTASAVRFEAARIDAGSEGATEADESAQPREAEARDMNQPTLRGGERITVSFEGEGGAEGRVHLALLGRSVHTTIVSPDAESARRMREDTSSLQRSLTEAGFRSARVTVRRVGRAGANRT